MAGGFRPLAKVTARWASTGNPGLEHLTLEQNDNRISAIAVIISADQRDPFGVWYQLFYDDKWNIKAVSVHRTDTHWFIAQSRHPGSWLDADGSTMKKFEGCKDVILSATPFTVTPIIRRLGLAKGEARELDALYVPITSLAPSRIRQRITCLNPGTLYRFENLTDGSQLEYEVDDDGLLTDEAAGSKRLA